MDVHKNGIVLSTGSDRVEKSRKGIIHKRQGGFATEVAENAMGTTESRKHNSIDTLVSQSPSIEIREREFGPVLEKCCRPHSRGL